MNTFRSRFCRFIFHPSAFILLLLVPHCGREKSLVVGSKNFTESVILGELEAQKLESAGCRVDRRLNLGGTLVCDSAIRSGSLDTYVEYSGTALMAILHQPHASLVDAYAKRGLHWGPELGFNDTFAMIVRRDSGLRTISDLKNVESKFQPGFGYEFSERPDGWKGLLQHYGLQFAKPPKTMELGLTYKALAAGQVDLIAGNSTDGLIESLGLRVLDDDRHYFPDYDAAVVYRNDLDPKCRAALDSLAGILDDATMRRLNYEVDGRKRRVEDVVREFLSAAPHANAGAR
ncbi:MAG TPA: glycine betaine ABC transporter substrate-binding protein [Thermoanaerobaculia bacterium]|nr:glycine betaine ABC transporter substrate-binding protein [Thermoanaerobaculia bacterium]